jgi:hypothetical protein
VVSTTTRGGSASVDRRRPVAGLSDHGEVGLGVDHHPEAGADELLVVDEQDADRSGTGHRGER